MPGHAIPPTIAAFRNINIRNRVARSLFSHYNSRNAHFWKSCYTEPHTHKLGVFTKKNDMNMYAALSSLTLGLFLAGCNYSAIFIDQDLTQKKPNEQDLIGRWIPTRESLNDMHTRGHYPVAKHEIELKSDRTFTMLNMPDWWSSPYGESRKGLDSGSGIWKLTEEVGYLSKWACLRGKPGCKGPVWSLALKFNVEKSFRSVDLARQKAPYLMVFNIGDPDNGYATKFERAGNP